jgi:hypothetical protein
VVRAFRAAAEREISVGDGLEVLVLRMRRQSESRSEEQSELSRKVGEREGEEEGEVEGEGEGEGGKEGEEEGEEGEEKAGNDSNRYLKRISEQNQENLSRSGSEYGDTLLGTPQDSTVEGATGSETKSDIENEAEAETESPGAEIDNFRANSVPFKSAANSITSPYPPELETELNGEPRAATGAVAENELATNRPVHNNASKASRAATLSRSDVFRGKGSRKLGSVTIDRLWFALPRH